MKGLWTVHFPQKHFFKIPWAEQSHVKKKEISGLLELSFYFQTKGIR